MMRSVSPSPELRRALLLAGALLAVPLLRAEVVERVVARVNGDIVTLSEFEARQIAAVQQARIGPARVESFLRENNQRILEEAIADLLILQRGAELGIRLRPEYVLEVIEGIKKENNIPDDAELHRQLRREGMTLEDLKRNIERSVVRRQVLARELENKVQVNDADVRAEYERRKAEFTRPERVKLVEIVVAAADAELARTIVEKARAGEDFAALARAHSKAPTAASGGDLGWFARGEMNPALEAVAFALPAGGVSDALPHEGGIRVVKVSEREAAGVVPFEQARPQLAEAMAQDRYATVYGAYVADLRKNALVRTMVSEVPLQVSVPTGGSILDAAPDGVGRPGAGAAPPADPEAEIVTTPQARPERVAPPPAPTATPAPPPSPSPGPVPRR